MYVDFFLLKYLLLLICLIVALFYIYKGIRKLFRRFVITTEKREIVWMWIKRGVMIPLSIYFLFLTFENTIHFHDEMQYVCKQYLNPEYAKKIKYETYLMSEQNVIDLFETGLPNPDTQDAKDSHVVYSTLPTDPRAYLVIRVKNTGDQIAWGRLKIFIGSFNSRDIDILPLPPNMKDYEILVLPSHQYERYEKRSTLVYPNIHASWGSVYTKEEGQK